MIVRPIRWDDASELGVLASIQSEAFTNVAHMHGGMPSDFPTVESARGFIDSAYGDRETVHGFVAETGEGTVVGANYLDTRNAPHAMMVGPISVRSGHGGAGRLLMEAALRKARDLGSESVRLVQTGYNLRSLSLYVKLGFEVREHLVTLNGSNLRFDDHALPRCLSIRLATADDLTTMNELCVRVHSIPRVGDVRQGVLAGTASIVLDESDRVVAYCTGLGYIHHAVALSNDALKLIIATYAGQIFGTGFNIPSRNSELFRWCLERGFVVQQALTLMSMGAYTEPSSTMFWLPSIGM